MGYKFELEDELQCPHCGRRGPIAEGGGRYEGSNWLQDGFTRDADQRFNNIVCQACKGRFDVEVTDGKIEYIGGKQGTTFIQETEG